MFEMLMALHVTDDAGYQRYREAMTPILERHGGGFGYDFRVSEVLRSQVEHPINRVFTIRFPDQPASRAFFAHPEYLDVRRRYFEDAVSAMTIIAEYTRE
ncbi:DUF1330 domain-containing protein [Sediminicurvatus halobius]|uniref:DUF1330 domain-containing protein n=1 Tax=Sediminicurvatus halobius TaxID=2182432 RepID=A0A2U2N2V6_9GAMM|nr:DUF1330 domain-containing protein [Spiribacter halobius]PWG63536.1 DUF1330 domain-containing protein [Spiribacter halobius]UEX79585.1 DUF1330 domain-containing protein [Spiribacter halobius]